MKHVLLAISVFASSLSVAQSANTSTATAAPAAGSPLPDGQFIAATATACNGNCTVLAKMNTTLPVSGLSYQQAVVFHADTSAIERVGIDATGAVVDDDAARLNELTVKKQQYGGIDPATYNALVELPSSESAEVDIWGAVDLPYADKAALIASPVATSIYQANVVATASAFQTHIQGVLQGLGLSWSVYDPAAPWIIASGPASALLALQSEPSILTITLRPAIAPPPLGDATYLTHIGADYAQDYGFNGSGEIAKSCGSKLIRRRPSALDGHGVPFGS